MISRLRLVSGLLAAAAALTVPRAARADTKTIDSNVTLGGDNTYDVLVIKSGATVKVSSFAMGGGWLRIKANKITVEPNAVIDATHAGYPGQGGKNGQCATGSNGCGLLGGAVGVPGSGGGYVGLGGDGQMGSTGACTTYGSQSLGGQDFFNMTTQQLALGSAGGAANAPGSPPPAVPGGDGGGGIKLEAAIIQIDGTLTAAGAGGFQSSGVASGGGSGGSIEITAASLSGSGTLSVRGGDGGTGPGLPAMSIPANAGGGGSGGVILLHLPSASTGSITFDVGGGKNGACGSSAAMGIKIVDPLGKTCVDVDGDKHESALCGGDDCDDADPGVNPDAKESCNGKDDDCKNGVDDGDLCAAGSQCVNGTCTAPDAGADGGADGGGEVDAGAPPDYLDFSGGCSLPSTDPSALPAAGCGALLLGLGVASLAVSRARPRRRRGKR